MAKAGPSVRTTRPSTCEMRSLLELDRRASLLELRLGLLRVLLLDTLEDRLGGLVHERLGLAQAEVRQSADLLDDLDLLVADGGEDDVVGVLLLRATGSAGVTATRSGGGSGDRERSGGGDLEGLLEGLHELGELDERELLECVDELLGAELRHDDFLFSHPHDAG